MKTKRSGWLLGAALLYLTMIAALATTASARNHVSWKGGFYISYPEAWRQIDYAKADAYLMINQAGDAILDYDAVFADTLHEAFYDGEYFVLTVDTVGELNEPEIDSVMEDLFSTFNSELNYFPVAKLLANLRANSPSYDPELKVASVMNEIGIAGGTVKRSLVMLRFYEKGIATFFYYAPDSLFEDGLQTMQQVVASLSTENIEAAAPREEVKVTDAALPERSEYEPGSGKSETSGSIPVVVLIGVLVVIITVARRKRKKRS
ncbi:MAG: hypothetical protein ABIE70_11685 [bacterium]